jgi:hypothetical protein
VDAAADLFEDERFWRDFVAFTWNLKTLEDKADIRRMLQATLDRVQPANWALAEDATGSTAADGMVEAWITFETGAARGYGHLRLRNGKCSPSSYLALQLKARMAPFTQPPQVAVALSLCPITSCTLSPNALAVWGRGRANPFDGRTDAASKRVHTRRDFVTGCSF